jgi:hypothetical protein
MIKKCVFASFRDNTKGFFKREELILLSFPIDPDPSRRGEVNILQLNELDSTRISALKKVS